MSHLMVALKYPLRTELSDSFCSGLSSDLIEKSHFVETVFWGGQDGIWLACSEFAERIGMPLKQADHFHAYVDFAKTCGISYLYAGVAFVSDRPVRYSRDNEGRLHREGGPALAFSDGYALYAWHGTSIPGDWIERPDALTPKLALTIENTELRRAACEILGWHRIVRELGATVIDDSGNAAAGTLIEVILPRVGDARELRARFLLIMCGTGREFAQCVPPETASVFEAQAYFQGLSVQRFRLPKTRT